MAKPAEKIETNSLFVEIGRRIDAADSAARAAMKDIERNQKDSLVKAVGEVDGIRLELNGIRELLAGLRERV